MPSDISHYSLQLKKSRRRRRRADYQAETAFNTEDIFSGCSWTKSALIFEKIKRLGCKSSDSEKSAFCRSIFSLLFSTCRYAVCLYDG